MRNTKEDRDIFNLDSIINLLCVLALVGLFLSNSASSATANKDHNLNANNPPKSSRHMERAARADCASAEMPLPMLPASIGRLPVLLNAIAPSVVYGDLENGGFKELRKPVTSPSEVSGVGRFIDYNSDTKSLGAVATGFLINECLVITNKHVVQIPGYTVENIIFQAGTNFEYEAQGTVVASGNYLENEISTFSGDWSVVKLNKNLANQVDATTSTKIGYLEALFSPEDVAVEAYDLIVVGLISDLHDADFKRSRLKKHEDCSAYGYANISDPSDPKKSINSGTVGTNCSALPGTSGSPILWKDDDGTYQAVGIMKNSANNNRETEFSGLNANLFIPFVKDPSITLSLTKEKLNKIKRDNPCP